MKVLVHLGLEQFDTPEDFRRCPLDDGNRVVYAV